MEDQLQHRDGSVASEDETATAEAAAASEEAPTPEADVTASEEAPTLEADVTAPEATSVEEPASAEVPQGEARVDEAPNELEPLGPGEDRPEPAPVEPAPERPEPDDEPAIESPDVSAPEETPAAEPAEVEEPAVEEPAAAVEPFPELAAAVNEAFAEAGVTEEEEDAALLDWQPGEWFVVHTYAGYENKVKTNLQSRIQSMNMEEKIFEVVIPVEDVMEVKSGKKQVVQRKVFPGYLLVRMDLDDDSWYVVRNTPGVTGFVGSGSKPIPLSDKEVDRVLQRNGPEERPKPRLEFSSGDGVRVVTGPFANFQGVISDIDADRSKLKVLVNIFGRETPVELGFDQVAKI